MTTFIAGEKIIAENIRFEDYLTQFQGQRVEYEDGRVIELSPATGRHNEIVGFLYILLTDYLEATKEGKLRRENITMRLQVEGGIKAPEPDLFVVTTPNLAKLTETYLDGAADLVIEVISEESDNRDRVKKFAYYETAGVREYWMIDPLYQEALFYVLGEHKKFLRFPTNTQGIYQSRVLPRLKLEVAVLFKDTLPTVREITQIVDKMLAR